MEERRLIGEILKDITDVNDADIDKALELQMNGDERKLGEILMEAEKVQSEDVVAALAEQYEMDIVDLETIDVDKRALDMVSSELAREHKMMPFSLQDDTLMVAIADPLDIYGLDALKFILNKEIRAGLATMEQIENCQNRFYGMTTSDIENMTKDLSQSDIQVTTDDAVGEDDDEASKPVIQLVHLIITEAVKNGASDIHIEPMNNRVRVRYRIDGICYEVDSPPKRLQAAITARLKIMAKMDMSEKRRPQDGRIMIATAGRKLDLRVNSLPATHGESIVMRILDKASIKFSLESLGFWPDDYKTFQGLCRKPNGVLLITGPTGSGKTTTLYSALNEMNHVDRKIITAEDPVEYMLSGINQCHMKAAIGFTFQRALRAMMRQAPDIILVGEIRDKETADIAIMAALTGHLVFSTLHTNDAPSAITRLIDMGVAPFMVASSIQAVMAQRLVRMICQGCKKPYQDDADFEKLKQLGVTEAELKGRNLWHGSGCQACQNRGFKGRKGIMEIMVMNQRIRNLAFESATTDVIRAQARRDGMKTLLEDGIRKVLEGLTHIDEVVAEAKALT